jgi:hypothetical protein
MLRLLAYDAGAVELTSIHRFSDPDEAAATIGIREGLPEALEFYVARDRVHSGSTDAMLEDAYEAWEHDTRTGLSSLLIAQSARDVVALNLRARAARIDAGGVAEAGVELRDGTTAGVGDLVVTRRNQRQLASRDGDTFVKNGDTWTVERVHRNGDLTIRDAFRPSGTVRLPHDYVQSAVELGYATTSARAQGRTVDTTHVLVDDSTTREAFYVAATRGRTGTHLYVQDKQLLRLNAERPPAPNLDVKDALVDVLRRESSERTATEVRREARATATNERPRRPISTADRVREPATRPPSQRL